MRLSEIYLTEKDDLQKNMELIAQDAQREQGFNKELGLKKGVRKFLNSNCQKCSLQDALQKAIDVYGDNKIVRDCVRFWESDRKQAHVAPTEIPDSDSGASWKAYGDHRATTKAPGNWTGD